MGCVASHRLALCVFDKYQSSGSRIYGSFKYSEAIVENLSIKSVLRSETITVFVVDRLLYNYCRHTEAFKA